MRNTSSLLIPTLTVLLASTALTGCNDLANPYSPYSPAPSGGYYDPYYGGNRSGNDYRAEREAERAREARHEYERERERLEEERRRLEEERRREAYRPPPPPPQQERCPSGFSPSENKCSKEERRRGCQDLRLPGGLGCVRR